MREVSYVKCCQREVKCDAQQKNIVVSVETGLPRNPNEDPDTRGNTNHHNASNAPGLHEVVRRWFRYSAVYMRLPVVSNEQHMPSTLPFGVSRPMAANSDTFRNQSSEG